jgi:hypothetical protein
LIFTKLRFFYKHCIFWCIIPTVIIGLYHKHEMILNYDSSVISKWSFKLIDDASVVIYDHNMFIIEATWHFCRAFCN